MDIIFFDKIRRLLNKQEYDKIMLMFVDLDYSKDSLKLINYSLRSDYDMFEDFMNYLAFLQKFNYRQMRYFNEYEHQVFDGLNYFDPEFRYEDDYDKYLYFKNNIMNGRNP